MDNPKYKISNKILDNLVKIASAREIILNAYLIPKWEVSLRREALIRNTHASTSIEGNPLSLEEVSKLAKGRKITATRKDKQEVLNYLYVLENISKFSDNNKITEKGILKLHKFVTKETLENPKDVGVYRNRQVFVGNRFTGKVTFMPPDTKEVPKLMREFVEWLNSDAENLNPVIIAGLAHYEFVRIHPFIDGNGRTARALATLILFSKNFDVKRFFALDDYYDSDRATYYRALKTVSERADLTYWLEYFTEGVKISIIKVKERILRLSSEKLRKDKKGQIALTERQMKLVELINQNGKITNQNVRELFKISDRAALKEIRKLVDLGIIKSKGKGRSLYYVMV